MVSLVNNMQHSVVKLHSDTVNHRKAKEIIRCTEKLSHLELSPTEGGQEAHSTSLNTILLQSIMQIPQDK